MRIKLVFLLGIVLSLGCFKGNDGDLQIAIMDYKLGKLTVCEKKLIAYTTKYPEDSKGWSFLGTVELELEHDSLASIAAQKAIKLNPEDYKALTNLGVLARHEKNYNKAASFYHKAIAIKPNYAQAYMSLLVIELKKNNIKEAIALGEKAVELDPTLLSAKANLALAYHYNKSYKERDELFAELKEKEYNYINELQLLFNGEMGIEDL